MASLEKQNLKDLKNFFSNRAKEIKEEKEEILSIIGPHLEKIDNSTLSEIDKQHNKKELIDLGKFLKIFDKTIILKEAIRESPDFIISTNNKTIGIELRDIYTDIEERKTEGTLDKMFREIENELKDREPDKKGVYKIQFKENISFRTQKRAIKNEIIHSIRTSETPQKYVKNIDIDPGNILHLYTSEASSLGPLNKEVVLDAIAKKEAKLSIYKSSSNASDFWLLLILGGLKDSSNYSTIDNSIIVDKFQTGFDKVFIFDFFLSKIIELKKQ
jgi:hypothetical protein